MKPSIKQQWSAALRSGEFVQTKLRLRDHSGFCVLGVLCELHRREVGGEWDRHCYLHKAGTLPDEVLQWAELSCVQVQKLSNLNDDGRSFEALAERIEKHL